MEIPVLWWVVAGLALALAVAATLPGSFPTPVSGVDR